MVVIIIGIIIIGIIITASAILLNSNQEKSIEQIWLDQQITSGPFTINNSQYNLGEKIFITVNNLPENKKGEMVFYRPLNNTAWAEYKVLAFNGEANSQFNLYFEPQVSEMREVCSTDQLVGTWIIKFIGTQYSDMTFELLNQTSSWDERTFDPVC